MHTKKEIKSRFERVGFLEIRESLQYDIDISAVAFKYYMPTIPAKGRV